MRRVIILALSVFLSSPAFARVSQPELQSLVQELLPHTGLRPQVFVHIDPSRAQGAAAVYGNQQLVNIWVDPQMMNRADRNTWAFILGHELGHPLRGLFGQSREVEQACDEYGARLAIAAGYNLQNYLNFMLENGSSCTPIHGCMHERAAILARKFNVEAKTSQEKHKDHPPMTGFPRSNSTPVSLTDYRTPQPCLHHGAPCTLNSPCFCPPVPCRHPKSIQQPCQHPIAWTPYGLRYQHPFDVVTIAAHPQGDAPHESGHSMPAPFCLRPSLP